MDQGNIIALGFIGWCLASMLTLIFIASSPKATSGQCAAAWIFWPLLWIKGLGMLIVFLVVEFARLVAAGWKEVWR